jgi:hypothetical protein
MKNLAILLLFLTSCASYHVRDINIYDKQVDTFMLELEGRLLINNALKVVRNEEVFKNWDFVFISGWIGKELPDGKIIVADGNTDYLNKVIYLKVHKCFWHSAIIHEMTHAIRFYNSGNKDLRHTDKIWKKIDKIDAKIIKEKCPADYNPKKQAPVGIQRF